MTDFDIHHTHRVAESPARPALPVVIAGMLAAILVVLLLQAPTDESSVAPGAGTEDWHGNVMRSGTGS